MNDDPIKKPVTVLRGFLEEPGLHPAHRQVGISAIEHAERVLSGGPLDPAPILAAATCPETRVSAIGSTLLALLVADHQVIRRSVLELLTSDDKEHRWTGLYATKGTAGDPPREFLCEVVRGGLRDSCPAIQRNAAYRAAEFQLHEVMPEMLAARATLTDAEDVAAFDEAIDLVRHGFSLTPLPDDFISTISNRDGPLTGRWYTIRVRYDSRDLIGGLVSQAQIDAAGAATVAEGIREHWRRQR